MKYQLFVSDFDGTLGSAPDIIDLETIDAIKKYTEKGGKFVICTGRMFAAIKPICEKYGIKGLLISYQGAAIDDLNSGKRIFEGGISPDKAVEIIKLLKAEGVDVVADVDDVMYCEKETEYTDFHNEFTTVVKVDNLEKNVLSLNKTVLKVVATNNPEVILPLTEKYNKYFKGEFICNNGSDRLLEIIDPKYSKGQSVRFLSNYFNIPLEKTLAVGDSTNDIELVKGEWHGVAVGDAVEELKKVADEVTVDFKDKPVKVLLEKYCL